jgi:hypothetical protein
MQLEVTLEAGLERAKLARQHARVLAFDHFAPKIPRATLVRKIRPRLKTAVRA